MTQVPRPVVQTVVVMRFPQIEGDGEMSRRWMDLDLDLDLDLALGGSTGPGGLGLGRWTLGLAGTEKRCGGSFRRLLVSCFQGRLAVGGYLGQVPYPT